MALNDWLAGRDGDQAKDDLNTYCFGLVIVLYAHGLEHKGTPRMWVEFADSGSIQNPPLKQNGESSQSKDHPPILQSQTSPSISVKNARAQGN